MTPDIVAMYTAEPYIDLQFGLRQQEIRLTLIVQLFIDSVHLHV